MKAHATGVSAAVLSLVFISPLAGQDMPEANQKAFLAQLKKIDAGVDRGPFKAEWKDLERHEAGPEWFLDAKFGIYFHWGIYTVTGTHEWYLNKMHTVDKFQKLACPRERYHSL